MYDLIMIGGGMSGISVAHFFRNQNILILERGQLLSEASGKNAGFVISGFGEHFNRTARRLGVDRAAEIQEIHRSNHARMREFAFECDYYPMGSLAVALTEKEQHDLQQSCEMMQKRGFRVRWIPHPETGLKKTMGAVLNIDDGCLDPVKFWNRIAAGLPVQTGCEARSVENVGDHIVVHTNTVDYECANVVFCLNAFADSLVPELKGRYIPLRGQIVELQLQSKAPTKQAMYTEYGDIYWRYSHRRLIFGGLDEEVGIANEVSDSITQRQVQWIDQHFQDDVIKPERQAPVPAVSNAQAGAPAPPNLNTRCSTMAFTVDGFPFVGKLPQPHRYVLSGLCGLGHGYAMECASWLHELIAHARNVIPPYICSDRINSLPIYSGGDWRNLYEAWNH